MSPFEKAIAKERARLLTIDNRTARDTIRAYGTVLARLEHDLDNLTDRIEAARDKGVEVRPGWLFAEERYRTLITQLEEHTLGFLQHTAGAVTNAQGHAVELAPDAARRLTVGALGPAPSTAVSELRAMFMRLPGRQLDRLLGYAGDGQPLGHLLSRLLNTQQVTDALAYGVAAGKNPRVIAREVQSLAQMTLTRALTISRTETIRAYRTASADQMQAMQQVVRGWTWTAEIGPRTCPACLAMHGTEHPTSETMDTHPNCRCTMVPRTASWDELGFTGIPDRRPRIPTGEEAFARLPEADRLAILGRRRLAAYDAGEISLEDLVRTTHSPRFGAGRRAATLTELSL